MKCIYLTFQFVPRQTCGAHKPYEEVWNEWMNQRSGPKPAHCSSQLNATVVLVILAGLLALRSKYKQL